MGIYLLWKWKQWELAFCLEEQYVLNNCKKEPKEEVKIYVSDTGEG